MDDKSKRRLTLILWKERAIAIIIAAVGAFLLGGLGVILVLERGPLEHAGYETGTVVFTTSYADEDGFLLTVVASLDDGREISVRTRSLALSAHVTDTVCLRVRKNKDDRRYYRIVPTHNCEDP